MYTYFTFLLQLPGDFVPQTPWLDTLFELFSIFTLRTHSIVKSWVRYNYVHVCVNLVPVLVLVPVLILLLEFCDYVCVCVAWLP